MASNNLPKILMTASTRSALCASSDLQVCPLHLWPQDWCLCRKVQRGFEGLIQSNIVISVLKRPLHEADCQVEALLLCNNHKVLLHSRDPNLHNERMNAERVASLQEDSSLYHQSIYTNIQYAAVELVASDTK